MVRCILQNRTGTHSHNVQTYGAFLNWWSLHHHTKRKEEHNNMLLLPDIVLFCSYVIAPSKYNGQVKTLFYSLSLCAEIVIHFVPPCWMHGTQKAILSDSLPCLICYHETRWYTYTHSAFWYLCRICQNSI